MSAPGRPSTEKEAWLLWNGVPTPQANSAGAFSWQLVSSGTTVPVNNATTASPFANSPLGGTPSPSSPPPLMNLQGTLAGKVLLLQATAAGCFLPSRYPSMSVSALNPIVTIQTGVCPGTLLSGLERTVITMPGDYGWLQWVSNSGAATLTVWELV